MPVCLGLSYPLPASCFLAHKKDVYNLFVYVLYTKHDEEAASTECHVEPVLDHRAQPISPVMHVTTWKEGPASRAPDRETMRRGYAMRKYTTKARVATHMRGFTFLICPVTAATRT